MRDFYPADMASRNHVFNAWRRASRLFGFEEYDACVVETLDLLKRKSGEEIVEQIYSFQDKSGRDLALRPEMTPTLARMVAARQGSLSFPVKWFAVAQCFRYERTTKGRKREHYQWNMDVLGENAVTAEAEVVAAAVTALSLMGLEGDTFRVLYSSRELLADLLRKAGIPPQHHSATFLALDKQGKLPEDAIRDMLEEAGVAGPAADRVLHLLRLNSLDDVEQALGESTESLTRVRAFADELDRLGCADRAVFDLSVVRGLTY
ncbi:ATP phosphoribosyltransferase regulatory subunit, partial [bacterium]|nr:ATP phosphoribosyltransferase regulatory subunit [bacterium]